MKPYAYFLCVMLAGATMAAENPAATPAAATLSSKAKSLSATGLVVSTDMVGNTITVNGKKKAQWVFAVPANAKITQGKKALSFADIAVGSKVSVAYVREGDVLTSSSIKIILGKK